jgi:hypothetical protein
LKTIESDYIYIRSTSSRIENGNEKSNNVSSIENNIYNFSISLEFLMRFLVKLSNRKRSFSKEVEKNIWSYYTLNFRVDLISKNDKDKIYVACPLVNYARKSQPFARVTRQSSFKILIILKMDVKSLYK